MKNRFFLFAIVLSIAGYSCQSGSDNNQSHQHQEVIRQGPAVDDHDHSEHAAHDNAELVLNDGEKWQTDQPTRENAAHLQALAKDFESGSPTSISEYHDFGTEVKEGIDQMIRECTMAGAPDQALHHWFFPILDQTGELKDTEDLEEARHLAHAMVERINVYDQYFE